MSMKKIEKTKYSKQEELFCNSKVNVKSFQFFKNLHQDFMMKKLLLEHRFIF